MVNVLWNRSSLVFLEPDLDAGVDTAASSVHPLPRKSNYAFACPLRWNTNVSESNKGIDNSGIPPTKKVSTEVGERAKNYFPFKLRRVEEAFLVAKSLRGVVSYKA